MNELCGQYEIKPTGKATSENKIYLEAHPRNVISKSCPKISGTFVEKQMDWSLCSSRAVNVLFYHVCIYPVTIRLYSTLKNLYVNFENLLKNL